MNYKQYQEAALSIGINMVKKAIWYKSKCNWVSTNNPLEKNSNTIIHHPLELDFYNGISGVCYFLAELYNATHDMIIKKHLIGSLEYIYSYSLSQVEEKQWGFYSGLSGQAYALYYGGHIINDDKYREQGIAMLRDIDDMNGIDIIDGSIGVVPFIGYLYDQTGDDFWKQKAINIGEKTLQKSERTDLGISWKTMEHKTFNLTGLAHGNSGFAWVYAELYRLTQDNQYVSIVEECIQYENNCKALDGVNWSDFRDFEKQLNPKSYNVGGSTAWCHGAPGIGLSRLRCFDIIRNNNYIQDIEDACTITEQSLILDIKHKKGNFSLCHGICGNADILLYYNQVFKTNKYQQFLDEIALTGIDNFISKDIDFPSGLNINQPNISFMLGDAGIGWFYLRMANKTKNPLLIGI